MEIKNIRKLCDSYAHPHTTQAEFCEKYKIPLDTLKSWESGRKSPPEYLKQLLEFKVKFDNGYIDKGR